jgi:hypothetical protein
MMREKRETERERERRERSNVGESHRMTEEARDKQKQNRQEHKDPE